MGEDPVESLGAERAVLGRKEGESKDSTLRRTGDT